MPYKFQFSDGAGHQRFECMLRCERCRATTKRGTRCSRNTCIGTGLCWMHLLAGKRLRIKASTIPGAGQGLFAEDRAAPAGAVLFRRLQRIIEYDGERINDGVLAQRYGGFTGPYAISNSRDEHLQDPFARRVEDGACLRGVGNLANHRPDGARANAFFFAQLNPDRIVLKASRNIRNGDEIFVDYGEDYQFDEDTQYSTRPARAAAAGRGRGGRRRT